MARSRELRAVLGLAMLLAATLGLALQEASGWYQARPWAEPSVLNIESSDPVLVADSAGDLHLFFVGRTDDNDRLAESTIYYMRRVGGQWSAPLDILVSGAGAARLTGVAIDGAGYFHLAWSNDENVYHSRAHASEAKNASSWQTEVVITGSLPTGEMVQDENGRLHLALQTGFQSVLYLYSDDGGENWSAPRPVDRVLDTENLAIGDVRMAVDQTGGLHVTWFQTALEVDWNLWSVWYGRSTDEGNSWQISEMAAPLFGASDVMVDGENNIHLLYGRNIGYSDGRWHQWSADGGETWTKPRLLYPGVEHASGLTGGYDFALDGDGRLHMVNSYGNRRGDASAWHMVWQGERWSEPESLLGTEYHAHQTRIAIANGNELNVVALAPRQQYSLVYRQKLTDGRATERQEVATPAPEAVGEVVPVEGEGVGEPTPVVPRVALSDEARAAPPSAAPFNSLLIAVGAAALVVLIVVLLARRLPDRRGIRR